MTGIDRENGDRILEIFAIFAQKDLTIWNWPVFERSFGSALKILGDEVFIFKDCVTNNYPELFRICEILRRGGFCRWISPNNRSFLITIYPRTADLILKKSRNRKLIESAAESWLKEYRGIY